VTTDSAEKDFLQALQTKEGAEGVYDLWGNPGKLPGVLQQVRRICPCGDESEVVVRDNTKVDAATVYVTLASDKLGSWNPFAWYPYVEPSKWAAIVTNQKKADVSDNVGKLIDRGYGWVYLTSESGFDTESEILSDLISAVQTKTNPSKLRKLQQARRLEASSPFWGCDDTLFECKPICLQEHGQVTNKVSSQLCAGAPQDQCACKCFHEAQWTCEGDSVVCKARFGAGDLETVGDKVCETRGAPKPASPAELRIASTCKPITEMRGSAPTAECLAQWSAPPSTTQEPMTELDLHRRVPIMHESLAITWAVAAVALHF
jgi:hypothetical protein